MDYLDIPICILSWKRWERSENKTMTIIDEYCSEQMQERTFLFVRAEQEEQYRRSFPKANIVVLPHVEGLSMTRQFIADYTLDELGSPYCIDVDDDITAIGRIHVEGGKLKSRATKETFEDSLNFAARIALDAMERSDCIIGGCHRMHFSKSVEAVKVAYKVNAGPTPRHIVFQNVRMMRERGIERDPIFDPTGDDVGLVAVCAKKSQNFFHVHRNNTIE